MAGALSSGDTDSEREERPGRRGPAESAKSKTGRDMAQVNNSIACCMIFDKISKVVLQQSQYFVYFEIESNTNIRDLYKYINRPKRVDFGNSIFAVQGFEERAISLFHLEWIKNNDTQQYIGEQNT